MFYPTTRPSLLEKLQQGNEISWDEFYNSYAPIIRCAGKTYDFDDSLCDDLVQMVMLKFFDSARNFTYRPGQSKFRSYLARIVKNQAFDMLRKRNCDQKQLRDYEAEDTVFEENFLAEWRQTIVREAKNELRRRVDAVTYQAFELYAWQNDKEAAAEKASKEVLAVLDKLVNPTEDAATRKQYLHPDIQEEVEVDLFILLNNIDSCRVWPDRAEVVASGEMFESPQKIYFQYQKGKWIITKVESE